jgi:hypothetical protein
MRQAARLEIWRPKAVVESRALEPPIIRGCEGPQPSRSLTAIKALISIWRASGLERVAQPVTEAREKFAGRRLRLPLEFGPNVPNKRTVFASITRAPRATPLQFVARPQRGFRVLRANPFDCQRGAAADSTAGNRAMSETQRHKSAPPHRGHCSLRRSHRGLG